MTEEKRKALEKVYVSSFAQIGANVDEEAFKQEWDKERKRISKLSHPRTDTILISSSILSEYIWNISSAQAALIKARKMANYHFDLYKNFKKDLKDSVMSYADADVRAEYNELKTKWKNASKEVIHCKARLSTLETKRAKFLDWYRATNDYIKRLEKENKELKVKGE